MPIVGSPPGLPAGTSGAGSGLEPASDDDAPVGLTAFGSANPFGTSTAAVGEGFSSFWLRERKVELYETLAPDGPPNIECLSDDEKNVSCFVYSIVIMRDLNINQKSNNVSTFKQHWNITNSKQKSNINNTKQNKCYNA